MAGIFICYRRTDAEGWAGRLSDSLKAELGRINIFRDVDDIPPGVEFDTYLNEAVGSCDVLIALIGPRWLAAADKAGLRRLDDPTDFTRLEISTALKRKVRVIPALVGGAQMPGIDELPDDIKLLARRQAYDLSDSRWTDDCRNLTNVLRPILRPARSLNVKLTIAATIIVGLVGGGYAVSLWNRHQLTQIKVPEETQKQAELDRQQKAQETQRQAAELDRQQKAQETQRQAELDRQRREQETQKRSDAPSPVWTQWQDPAQYQQEFDRQMSRRWYPRMIEAQSIDGVVKYRASFEPFPTANFEFWSHHSLSDAEFSAADAKYVAQGLKRLSYQRTVVGSRAYNQGTWTRP